MLAAACNKVMIELHTPHDHTSKKHENAVMNKCVDVHCLLLYLLDSKETLVTYIYIPSSVKRLRVKGFRV